MSALTKAEMLSILEHLRVDTNFPRVKRVAERTISYFNNKCPRCKRNIRKNSRLIRVFKETSDLDIVTYVCKRCGTVFRKYEDKR